MVKLKTYIKMLPYIYKTLVLIKTWSVTEFPQMLLFLLGRSYHSKHDKYLLNEWYCKLHFDSSSLEPVVLST